MTRDRADILLVDDHPNNLRLLAEILTREGYKVRKVLSGNQAIDAAQLAPPDLILLDIMMPDLDGYEVCQRLKASEQTRDIPIIFLSALNGIDDMVKAFAEGGVDYITKPFQKQEVLARVKTHLQLQFLTKTLQAQNTHLSEEVTQRQAAEAALKQALADLKSAQDQIITQEKLAALGTLTAGVAHELRNPLNFVINFAESSIDLGCDLEEAIAPELPSLSAEAATTIPDLLQDLKENSASIYQHGQRAANIINSMMEHARQSDDAYHLTDINALLEEAITLAYHSKRVHHPGFHITIEKQLDPNLNRYECLPTELSRAFINLIDNAFYAVNLKQRRAETPDFAPCLRLQTRCLENQAVEIRIWDNGIGIAPEQHSKIFEPFFTTKPTGQGTGLGLSMTHEIIVGKHQGTIRMETEPGCFTEFIVTLPPALSK